MTTLGTVLKMRAHGLRNCYAAIRAAKRAGIPLAAACALLNKESMGMNVYGHDPGGAMSAPDGHLVYVTKRNFQTFIHMVQQGHLSNGVGPCQITWSGWFPDMKKKGLKPWVPQDNMVEGFQILRQHYVTTHTWRMAAQTYNGTGPMAVEYGIDFLNKMRMWQAIVGTK